jgi:hypothetical protein
MTIVPLRSVVGVVGTIAAVETLPVGSAKVPHLGVFDDLVGAADEVAAQRAIVARGAALEAYAARLEGLGFESMAKTARRGFEKSTRNVALLDGAGPAVRGVDPERLSSDQLSLLEFVYGATFKTAGAATMQFCPWVAAQNVRGANGEAGAASCELAESGLAGQTPRLTIDRSTFLRMTQANALIVERAAGVLAEAARRTPGQPGLDAVLAQAISLADSHGITAAAMLRDPLDPPSILKIDYKWCGGGDLVVVDVTPAFMGVWYDDEMLDEMQAETFVPGHRITPRSVQAVLELYAAEHGRAARSVALAVLDDDMVDTWYEIDIAGLGRAFAEAIDATPVGAGGSSESCEPVAPPVLTLTGLEALAVHVDDPGFTPPIAAGGPWSGLPDLIVQYSFKVGRAIDPALWQRLIAAGVCIVDARHHALLAAKESATPRVIGRDLPPGVKVPELLPVGTVAEFAGHDGALVDAVWEATAAKQPWQVVTVKTEKLRRANAPGDYPTAFIFPRTPVGRRVAEKQLARILRQLSADGGDHLRFTVSEVVAHGGLVCADAALRDVEMRTYAFPVGERRLEAR